MLHFVAPQHIFVLAGAYGNAWELAYFAALRCCLLHLGAPSREIRSLTLYPTKIPKTPKLPGCKETGMTTSRHEAIDLSRTPVGLDRAGMANPLPGSGSPIRRSTV